jgi:hypothetical protein
MKNDLIHYVLRPYMPLAPEMAAAAGLDPYAQFPHTWSNLSDAERQQLWASFPMEVTVATFAGPSGDFVSVAGTEHRARAAIERAWLEHVVDLRLDPTYPVGDETRTVTGLIGSVWRDGSPYPKGDN